MKRALAVGAAVLAGAGCGSSGNPQRAVAPPRLPRTLAQSWARQASAVGSSLAAGDACTAKTLAARLQSQVIAAVNANRVPRKLLEPLSSGVNDLISQIACVPPPAVAPVQSGKHGHGPGKHGKHGKDEGD